MYLTILLIWTEKKYLFLSYSLPKEKVMDKKNTTKMHHGHGIEKKSTAINLRKFYTK
jgi:hypothetical protein